MAIHPSRSHIIILSWIDREQNDGTLYIYSRAIDVEHCKTEIRSSKLPLTYIYDQLIKNEKRITNQHHSDLEECIAYDNAVTFYFKKFPFR